MTKVNANTSTLGDSSQIEKFVLGAQVKTWIGVFALTSLALLVLKPAAVVTATIVAALMLVMAMIVHNSVFDYESESKFDIQQKFAAVLAPAHFACLIWLAVHAGRMILDSSLLTSSLAAFISLALIVLIDAVISIAVLLTAERADSTRGASVAALISSKYAGLLGKIN